MTQNQFDSDPNDFEVTASSDAGEFDGLDMAKQYGAERRRSRLPLMIVLLILLGGCFYFVYTVFLGGGVNADRPVEIAAPVDAAPVADVAATDAAPLPPGVVAPEAPIDPAAPVDATAPAPTQELDVAAMAANAVPADPNAVPQETAVTEAAALPAPADMAAPEQAAPVDAAVAPVASEEETATAAMPAPSEQELAAAAPPVVAEAPTPEPTAVVGDAAPAVEETKVAAASEATATVAPEAPAAVPEQQLKPVDAAPAPAKEEPKVEPKTAPKTSEAAPVKTSAKEDKAADAVKEILGKDPILSADAQADAIAKQNATLEQQTDVTPRAKQVIIVKKAYDRESPQAVNAAADRVMDAGQYSDAASLYDRQLRNNPSDPLALAGKALALQKAGRTDEAIQAYDRLLQLNPRDIDALTNSLGLTQQQDPQKALIRLQALTAQYPENATITGQLGMVQARLNDTPNALRSFQKAMALEPMNPVYPYNLAVLYDRMGNASLAREGYRQALDIANAGDGTSARQIPLDVIRKRLQTMGN